MQHLAAATGDSHQQRRLCHPCTRATITSDTGLPALPCALQIIFASRTHSQLSQFVGELHRTPFADEMSLVALGSRKVRRGLHRFSCACCAMLCHAVQLPCFLVGPPCSASTSYALPCSSSQASRFVLCAFETTSRLSASMSQCWRWAHPPSSTSAAWTCKSPAAVAARRRRWRRRRRRVAVV